MLLKLCPSNRHRQQIKLHPINTKYEEKSGIKQTNKKKMRKAFKQNNSFIVELQSLLWSKFQQVYQFIIEIPTPKEKGFDLKKTCPQSICLV